jgi:hypothetical protein
MAVLEPPPLPPVSEQVERLARFDLHIDDGLLTLPQAELPEALVAVRHDAVPAAVLASMLIRQGKPGFVVEDLTDVGAGCCSSPMSWSTTTAS